MKCRHCGTELLHTFVDLGSAPPSNAYLTDQTLEEPEKWYPLKVLVCDGCWLVQTVDFVGQNELFSEDYAYFTSVSTSMLAHAREYVEQVIPRFNLTETSTVVEIAANDGYLLQYFKKRGIPCFGVEPTHSTAQAAREKSIEIVEEFFSATQAKRLLGEGRSADLMIANNVLAHVPNINEFVEGFAILLNPNGVVTFEFPHLLNLIKGNQFDTIYHEHFSYLSLTCIQKIFSKNGLAVFDVEEIPTHGGSLRVFAQRSDYGRRPLNDTVKTLEMKEREFGITTIDRYRGFQEAAGKIKTDFLEFLVNAKRHGKSVAGYGAAAKGNTLMNFSGVRDDLVSYVVDKSESKQGKYMPGSRIFITDEGQLKFDKIDFVLILPWNIQREVMEQLKYIREWGGKFVTVVPTLNIL